MVRKFIIVVILVPFFFSICQTAVAAPPNKLFETTLQDIQGGGRVLEVVFYEKLPSPTIVDKILRESLDHAALIDSNTDIVAMGFLGDATLNENQYSGALVYQAKQKKIVTMNEYDGVKTTNSNNSNYFVEIEEHKTAEGITPQRTTLFVTIVFAKKPDNETAYNALYTEAQKLAVKGLHMYLFVSIGDKNVKTSWKQMKAKDGGFIFAEYDEETKKLTRKDKVLKQL